jgi:RHS repeat-associated protein
MAGISIKSIGSLENKKWKYQKQEFDDELGLSYYEFKWRNYDPQICRFNQIDPLSVKYEHNSPFAFAENKVISFVELEGLEGMFFGSVPPWANLAFEGNNVIPKTSVVENIVKSGAENGTRTSKGLSTEEVLENLNRGKATESEQLAKNGLDKNTKPIETIDPKTGKPETTIPDALKNDGKSTVEIKDVKSQGLTRQLRLQEKISNGNGFRPELIINESAKLSKPLQESSFQISKYSILPAAASDKTHLKPTTIVPFKPTERITPSIILNEIL